MTASRSGIPLKDFYAASAGVAARDEIPGAYPYTRGRHRPAQSGQGWIHRELSGEGNARRSNEQIKYLIGIGQMGVDVIGDSPTQSMLDPDHPLVKNAVGTQGVSLCCRQDYLELYAGIPYDKVSISSSVPSVFSMTGLYIALREHGFPHDRARGSVLQAPLYAEDCSYSAGMPYSLLSRLALDGMSFAAKYMPRFHAYVEDTYFFSETGLTGIEEMALGFVEIRHLTRSLIARGVPVDSFAPRIAILVNCSMDLFEEIAKIRATRRLFARMMKEEFGAQDPRSLSVVISAHTSGLTLTAQQPANNIVRGTVQGMALALAGVQAMEISAFDEGFRTPSAEAHMVGIRTQQILELECGVARVEDPLGGSYYVEALTDEMEHAIWRMVGDLEARGDPVALAEQGYFRRLFEQASERHYRSISSGKVKVVGVNCHKVADDEDKLLRDIAERKIAPDRQRIEEVKQFRAARSQAAVGRALRRLHDAVATDENLIPLVIEATDAGATMGEMAGAMRLACGRTYDPHRQLQPDF